MSGSDVRLAVGMVAYAVAALSLHRVGARIIRH